MIEKSINFRHVDISFNNDGADNSGHDLYSLLKKCVEKFEDKKYPTFKSQLKNECLVAHRQDDNNQIYLHLVLYEEGAGVAVISNIEDLENVEINEYPSPNDKEYIEAQLFLLCEKNKVAWCTQNHNIMLRHGTICKLLEKLIIEYLGPEYSSNIFFTAQASYSKIMSHLSEGISSIDLNLTGYKEALEFAQQEGRVENRGVIGTIISLLSTGAESTDNMDKIHARFIIKPGRFWEKDNIKTHLFDVAKSAWSNTDEDGDVTITTKSNATIKSSELIIKDKIEIKGNKRVLDAGDVCSKLKISFRKFMNDGRMD